MPRKRSTIPALPSIQPVVSIEPVAVPISLAAQLLGVTVRQIRTLGYVGKLRPIRLGKRFVYPVASLREFIEQRRAA
jgi:hypothetical protein